MIKWMADRKICIFGFDLLEAIHKVKSTSETIMKQLLKIQ